MNKFFRSFLLCLFLMGIFTVSAYAAADTLKVGLRYGSGGMFSANLQNVTGSGWGYEVGYYDGNRNFVTLGSIDTNEISMTADGAVYIAADGTYSPSGSGAAIGGYHIQLSESFSSWEEVSYAAGQFEGAFPAYINGTYRLRIGHFMTRADAAARAALYVGTTWRDSAGGQHAFSADAAGPTGTAVTITVTGTQTILFEFDCSGAISLGVMPVGASPTVTWFKGYRYYGGFEYPRTTGGNLSVINVLPLEDYVKGVVPYEMSPSWSLEALKAQAVCARTYALRATWHRGDGFDVCNGTDCQVYYGVGSATALSDRAVEETAGLCLYYNGQLIEAVYSASNGGASESAKNVWGSDVGYLQGKIDPYESAISIPSYQYSVAFTARELSQILASKGRSVGTVRDVYVSSTTDVGNVAAVTFVGSTGTVTVTGETCRTIWNGVISGKSVRSQRYTISGGSGGGGGYPVNGDGAVISEVGGNYVISGGGTISAYSGGETYVMTGSGLQQLQPSGGGAGTGGSAGVFTITGAGSGHNVGMSQYGAKAMAELGYGYEEILHFYYTDVTIERAV